MLDDQFSMFDHDSKKMFENCTAIQMMIDIYTDRLEGLRTQCSTSAELIQQEIRTLEVGFLKIDLLKKFIQNREMRIKFFFKKIVYDTVFFGKIFQKMTFAI